MNHPKNTSLLHHRPRRFVVALLVALLVLATGGCTMADMAFSDGENAAEEVDQSAPAAAETALRNHDISGARQIYADHLEDYPGDGTAAAGLAITDLLLVLGMEDVTKLLVDHLGASGSLNANRVIFGEEGYLYWASRGARWSSPDESSEFQGIRTLLADDLPWSKQRMSSLAHFVDGLDEPVDKLARQLVAVANALRGVDLNLETAINDPDFIRLYIPGQVFHDSKLTLVLGRSELSALRSSIALFRSAIYFLAAYEQEWTLQGAFGHWRFGLPLDDSRYVEDYGPGDYAMAYLDGHLFRRISSTERLTGSRTALIHAFETARDTVRYGIEERSSTTMNWENVDHIDAQALDLFFAAMIEAVDGPVVIPNTQPAITVDLSSFFDEGRVLDGQIPWFVQLSNGVTSETNIIGGEDTEYIWTVNEEASQDFWLQGVIDPIPDDQPGQAIVPGDDGIIGYVDLVLGEYFEAIEDVYFKTR